MQRMRLGCVKESQLVMAPIVDHADDRDWSSIAFARNSLL